jgi:hypothetical protein
MEEDERLKKAEGMMHRYINDKLEDKFKPA